MIFLPNSVAAIKFVYNILAKLNFVTMVDHNKKILSNLKDFQFGLANGKMGICIYFYILSIVDNNDEYKKIGESMLDDVINNLSTSASIDIESGLSGIAIGIDFLCNHNIIEGDINDILEDIDDRIFKSIMFEISEKEQFKVLDITCLLYYCYIRYLKIEIESQKFIFKRLIMRLMEVLYQKVDFEIYKEPLSLSIYYYLPFFLYVFSKIVSLNIYNYRLIKIFDEFSMQIAGLIPNLHSNRLFLLWGLSYLNAVIYDKRIQENINILKHNIDLNIILGKELADQQVFINDGVSLIYFLLKDINEKYPINSIECDMQLFKKRLSNSKIWDNEEYIGSGLLYGFAGPLLVLSLINNS